MKCSKLFFPPVAEVPNLITSLVIFKIIFHYVMIHRFNYDYPFMHDSWDNIPSNILPTSDLKRAFRTLNTCVS